MKKNSLHFFALLAVSLFAIACHAPERPSSAQNFIDDSAIDATVKPGDNFYMYVHGRWIRNAVIPETENGVGTFVDMDHHVESRIHGILDSVAKGGFDAGSIAQKVGDFYASGMDSATIEKLGYDPVKPVLAQIDALKNSNDVMQFDAQQAPAGNESLFYLYIDQDVKNGGVNIANFYQTGLGLPDRDYYFKTDSATIKIQEVYQTYIKTILTLTGSDSATAVRQMWAVYNLEKELATGSRNNTEMRDPQSNYHKMSLADLDKKMPLIGWKTLFKTLGLKTDSANICQPMYYAKLNELLKSTPAATWKAYFYIYNIDAKALSSPFVNASFTLDKALTGQQKMKPRWQRVYRETSKFLGDPLGELYVGKYFTEEAKKRMLDLVKNLETTFEARINKLDWMSDSTKKFAIDKLHSTIVKVGFPDKWRDYSNVTIDRNKYYENRISCSKNEYQYQLSRLGKPVDKSEWNSLTVQTVDAYNMGAKGIIFPAGLLQPPFFDPNADDAINYGAAGTFIGHELTHGFDNRGAQYDKDQNLRNWWSRADSEKFVAKTKLVINQFDAFTVLDTIHVNGALTVSENIADLGGLNIAYDAFKQTRQGQDTTRIDGFTPDQRFFISFANVWKSKEKPERTRYRINADAHAPWIYRVNGSLSNFTPFYVAFNVQPGDKMYKTDSARIKIW